MKLVMFWDPDVNDGTPYLVNADLIEGVNICESGCGLLESDWIFQIALSSGTQCKTLFTTNLEFSTENYEQGLQMIRNYINEGGRE